MKSLCSKAFPAAPPSVVVSVAVPEAEVTGFPPPALHVAEVGAAVALWPLEVMTQVAPVIVFAVVSVPVAVAVLESLNAVSSTV
jgi:hypothetical protein